MRQEDRSHALISMCNCGILDCSRERLKAGIPYSQETLRNLLKEISAQTRGTVGSVRKRLWMAEVLRKTLQRNLEE